MKELDTDLAGLQLKGANLPNINGPEGWKKRFRHVLNDDASAFAQIERIIEWQFVRPHARTVPGDRQPQASPIVE